MRTRPTGTLRNGAAPGGPTVCVSCGTGALSSLFVVRHTCTHVSPVVPPTFPNVTFSRCLVTIVPITYIGNNLCDNFSRNATNIILSRTVLYLIVRKTYFSRFTSTRILYPRAISQSLEEQSFSENSISFMR